MAKVGCIFRSMAEGFECQAKEYGFPLRVSGEPLKHFNIIGVVLHTALSGSRTHNKGRENEDRRLGDNSKSLGRLR